MTVQAGSGRSDVWTADGINRNWPFSFKILTAEHARLELTALDGSVSEVSSGFTLLGAGDEGGGQIVYPVAPAGALTAGTKVQVVRRVPYSQPSRIGNQGGFHAKTHEDTFDLLAMQVQQVYEGGTARGLHAPLEDGVLDMTLPAKASRAGKVLEFDESGEPVALVAGSAIVAAGEEASAAAAAASDSAAAAAQSLADTNQAAAQVAELVGSIDPSNNYTKVESDQRFAPRTVTQPAGGGVERPLASKIMDGFVTPADFGGDIQKALNSGKPVFLPPGTHTIPSDQIIWVPSGAYLFGVPGLSILYKETTQPGSYSRPLLKMTDVQDVLIEGITFEEALGGQREYAFIVGASSFGLTRRIYIDRCTFKNAPIHVERHVDGFWFTHNNVLGGGSNGALVGIATGGYQNPDGSGVVNADGLCRNINILNNYFEQTRSEAIDINWHTHAVNIIGNTCVDCDQTGGGEVIDVGGATSAASSANCRYVTIRDNTIIITKTGTNGIQSKIWSLDVKIINNTIQAPTDTGSDTYGIRMTRTTEGQVIGNRIFGFGRGIQIDTEINRCAVESNLIRAVGRIGILAAVSPVRDLKVLNNIVDGAGLATQHGIQISDTWYVDVSHNTVVSFAGNALLVTNGVLEGQFNNNHTRGNGSDGVTNQAGVGVFVDGSLFIQGWADDAAFSFTPPRSTGIVHVVCQATATNWASVFYRTGASPVATKGMGGTASAAVTTPVTGATGTDGNLTVGVHTDGKIYVENRTGAARNILVSFSGV